MGKKWIEVCLICGRGLRRSCSSLWKLQWYAVGWIHSDDKYCTTIRTDAVWKTRFSAAVDDDDDLQNQILHVQVYCRDPIFLRETLFGSATIHLKEFFDKFCSRSHSHSHSHAPNPNPFEEVGSFQLRKRNSNKPLGFLDVSIRISREIGEDPSSSSLGVEEGFNLDDDVFLQPSKNGESSYQMPIPPNYYPPVGGATVRSYQPSLAPHTGGYIPNIFPNYAPRSMSSTLHGGIGMGLGVGALASGAVIDGLGFDIAAADAQDASVSLATNTPF